MSYISYQIEIANPRGERYEIRINILFLYILCRLAENRTVPQIRSWLEKIKICIAEETIEGYIQEMKKELFQLKLPGDKSICHKWQLAEAAIKFGLIAERGDRHEIIIEETLASRNQPKLFD